MAYSKEKEEKWRSTHTALTVEKSTRERLLEIGHMGDTFDYVINMLIDHYHKTKEK